MAAIDGRVRDALLGTNISGATVELDKKDSAGNWYRVSEQLSGSDGYFEFPSVLSDLFGADFKVKAKKDGYGDSDYQYCHLLWDWERKYFTINIEKLSTSEGGSGYTATDYISGYVQNYGVWIAAIAIIIIVIVIIVMLKRRK